VVEIQTRAFNDAFDLQESSSMRRALVGDPADPGGQGKDQVPLMPCSALMGKYSPSRVVR
jgi:hypothetical protein